MGATGYEAIERDSVVFMFADLRDFTSFTLQYGDEAAFRLVKRFYSVVRSRALGSGGTEWKREGDRILFTFAAADDAVVAALSVQDEVASYNQSNPDTPIQLGIGIDAGEPIAMEGDYIGTTVNRTARITTIAKRGQVLVTDSVCHLAQNITSVRFLDRGRHKLKGFGESQRLYEPVRCAESHQKAALGPSLYLTRLRPLGAIAGVLRKVLASRAAGGARRYLLRAGTISVPERW